MQRLLEIPMDATRRDAALAQLQARRQLLQGQLAQVERGITQARRQVNAAAERLESLTNSQRDAA